MIVLADPVVRSGTWITFQHFQRIGHMIEKGLKTDRQFDFNVHISGMGKILFYVIQIPSIFC